MSAFAFRSVVVVALVTAFAMSAAAKTPRELFDVAQAKAQVAQHQINLFKKTAELTQRAIRKGDARLSGRALAVLETKRLGAHNVLNAKQMAYVDFIKAAQSAADPTTEAARYRTLKGQHQTLKAAIVSARGQDLVVMELMMGVLCSGPNDRSEGCTRSRKAVASVKASIMSMEPSQS